VVKGRHNSGALCPVASMVTGDAMTLSISASALGDNATSLRVLHCWMLWTGIHSNLFVTLPSHGVRQSPDFWTGLLGLAASEHQATTRSVYPEIDAG